MLFLNLLKYEFFHFRPVISHQILNQFFFYFIERAIFSVLHLLSNWDTILIDNNQNLLWFSHFKTNCFHNFFKNILIYILKNSSLHSIIKSSKRSLSFELLFKICTNVVMEKINSNFEDLILINLHHHK